MGTLVLALLVSLSGLVLGMAILMSVLGVLGYLRACGKRLVVCPDAHCVYAVELDAKGAGLKAARGGAYLWLQDCSRWPEKKDCAQACLTQVEDLGQGCLVQNVVAGWYKGKSCVYCHNDIDSITDWTGQSPALLSPAGISVAWSDVPAEKLPEMFTTHEPVCWSCHIAETFRREHPELVTDRAARW